MSISTYAAINKKSPSKHGQKAFLTMYWDKSKVSGYPSTDKFYIYKAQEE